MSATPAERPASSASSGDNRGKSPQPHFKPKTPSPTQPKAAESPAVAPVVEPAWVRLFIPANLETAKKFELCYPKIRIVLNNMKTEKALWLKPELSRAWRFLSLYNSTSSYGKDIASLWNQKVADHDFVAIYRDTFDVYFTGGYLNRLCITHKEIHNGTSEANKKYEPDMHAYDNFSAATSTLWNTTDSCFKMCEQVWKLQIPKRILKLLQEDPGFAPDKGLCKAFISVIMNALRRSGDNATIFRDLKGVETVLKYRNTKDTVLNVIASCTLAYGASEEQIKTIPNMEGIVNFLLYNVLLMATKRENRRYRGFSVEETLEAIHSMAAQMKVQELLIQPRSLDIIAGVLKAHKEEEELIQVTQLLWTLSFDETIKAGVKERIPDLTKTLTAHAAHLDPAVRKAVAGCLWNYDGVRPKTGKQRREINLDEDTCPLPMPVLKKGGGGLDSYIMISYDWGKKELVLLLNQSLKAHGFSTWIDVEQMSGSTLDAMADAVEKAAVVVICVSDRYKESPNCRAEAEYAFKLAKPIVPLRMQAKFKPDGWLGILMGTKFYFDCVSKADVAPGAERVTHEIRKNYANTALSPRPSASLEKSRSVPDITQPRPDDSNPDPELFKERVAGVKTWDTDAVKKWLKEHEIDHLGKKLGKRFDGKLVNQLSVLYATKPTIFMAMLERLRIDHPEDVLKLTSAIESQPYDLNPY